MREVLSDYARVILSVFHESDACACNQCVPGSLFYAPATHAESLGTRLVDGLQSDGWILLKCFRSRVMAGSP